MPVIVDVAKPTADQDGSKKQKRKRRTKKQSVSLPKLDTLGIVRDYETKEDIEARTRISLLTIF